MAKTSRHVDDDVNVEFAGESNDVFESKGSMQRKHSESETLENEPSENEPSEHEVSEHEVSDNEQETAEHINAKAQDSKESDVVNEIQNDDEEKEEGEIVEDTTECVKDKEAPFPWMFSMAELCKGQKMLLPVEGVYYPARINAIHVPDL